MGAPGPRTGGWAGKENSPKSASLLDGGNVGNKSMNRGLFLRSRLPGKEHRLKTSLRGGPKVGPTPPPGKKLKTIDRRVRNSYVTKGTSTSGWRHSPYFSQRNDESTTHGGITDSRLNQKGKKKRQCGKTYRDPESKPNNNRK